MASSCGCAPMLSIAIATGSFAAASASACRVLMLTAHAGEERVLQALRAGARGFVVKSSDLEELVLAIRSVCRGNTFFSTELSRDFPVDEVIVRASREDTRSGCDLLTSREREVLQLIAEGLTNTRIADELVVTMKTIEAHKAHIAGKLGTGNRTDLIRYASRGGLVALGQSGLAEAPLLAG